MILNKYLNILNSSIIKIIKNVILNKLHSMENAVHLTNQL